MNEDFTNIITRLETLKDFIIYKGTTNLIDKVKPILISFITDIKKENINILGNEEYENFIKFLEHLHKQGFISTNDENKLLSLIPTNNINNLETTQDNDNLEQLKKEKLEVKVLHKILDDLKTKILTTEIKNKEAYEVFQNTLDEVNKKHLNALDEFKNHKNALEEDTKLLVAKEYWFQKAKRHSSSAFWAFIMFLFPIVLLISLIIIITKQSTNPIFLDTNQTIDKTLYLANSSNSLLHYLPYLLIFSLLIWVSRIFLKVMFSNLHLKEEALEKETQILTYLALIKEGAGLEENDRKLILEAIFRPSTNGLIKDESNVTLLDIANIFKGK